MVAVAIPVTQDWRGLTWQSWGRLSARCSLEARERETLQGCALARCVLRLVRPCRMMQRYDFGLFGRCWLSPSSRSPFDSSGPNMPAGEAILEILA